jgi:iron complex outermembrane receptor protein
MKDFRAQALSAGAVAVLLLAGEISLAAAVTTEVEGTKGITDGGCMQQLTLNVGDGENCMYNGGPAQLSNQPLGEVTGPFGQVSYYDSLATPGAFDAAFEPSPGDGKIEQVITGTVTIDDAGTPGDGSDDLISFTLTFTSPGGGDIIRYLDGSGVVDRYTSMTQVLTNAPVSSATPNAQGGYDYVIGSQGFPSLRSFAEAPCEGQIFGSVDCGGSFTPGIVDPNRWSGVSVAGIGSLEGNIGVRTVGTLVGYQCAQDVDECTSSSVSFGPRIANPSAVTREDVGWDQLLLRVSTNANGNVINLAGFDVQEYTVFGPPPPCGSDPESIRPCNSWIAGYFTAESEFATGKAADDGPFVVEDGVPTELNILANDLGFADPVTVTIVTEPTKGEVTVDGSPGNAAGITITYTAEPGSGGPDSFVYSISSATGIDTATVSLIINYFAANDTATTTRNVPVTINALANDIGFPDPVTVEITGAPNNGGSVEIQGDLPGPAADISILYTPSSAPGTPGYTETFSYTITGPNGEVDTATVSVSVTNRVPAIDLWGGAPISADKGKPSPSTPVLPFITLGDGTAGQHTLEVTTQAQHGTCQVSLAGQGSFIYTPNDADFTGEDSCVLTLTDLDDETATDTVNIVVAETGEVRGRIGGAGSLDGASLLLLAALGALRRLRRRAPGAVALSGAALALGIAATPAQAIEEITVTARKVEESLMEVPLAITAFGGDDIEAARITNLSDVAELTPGLSFFNAFGEFLPVPVIRGVVPTDIFGTNSAAVFVDGVYVSGREGLNFSQLDLERIEVVKGPQSALYGRDAFSGAINYVTRAPSDVFEAKTTAELGNRGKNKGSIMVSGPLLGETLTGRISALYDEWDGSYDNTWPGGADIGGYRYRSIQSRLRWRPADDWDINLSYYHSNDDIDESGNAALPANCENAVDSDPNVVRLLNYCGEIPGLKDLPRVAPGLLGRDKLPKVPQATGENRELDRLGLVIEWERDYGTWAAMTGYSNTEQRSVTDFGRSVGELLPFLYCDPATAGAPGEPNSCGAQPANKRFFAGIYNPERGDFTEEVSQEIRFTSPQDRRLRFLGGAYWYNVRFTGKSGAPISTQPLPASEFGDAIGLAPFDPTSAPNFAIGTAIFYPTFTADGGMDPLNRNVLEEDTDAWAVFGALDYDFTDRLTGRVELRLSQERIEERALLYALCNRTEEECGDDQYDLDYLQPLMLTASGICRHPDGSLLGAGECSAGRGRRFDQVTGRVGLDFRLNPDWMIYGSIAKGEKPGGINLIVATVLVPPEGEGAAVPQERVIANPFEPEEMIAYELGAKGTFLDGRVIVDATLFYNDWKDIVLRQLQETDPDSGFAFDQPVGFNVNAGDAGVLGAELTLGVNITDNLSGRITAAWVDSELDKARQDTYADFPSFRAPGCETLPGDPDAAAACKEASGDVSGNKLLRQPEWTSSASLTYRRQLINDWEWYARSDVSYQGDVYLGNDNQSWLPAHTYVNASLGFESGRYRVELWGRNLFNDDNAIAAFRDIYFTNTDNIYPPYVDQGPRPDFNQFPPLRYTVTYPRLRTYGISFEMRFGGAVR